MKPKRKPKTSRKVSLVSIRLFGTCFGVTPRSGEHLVALPEGGPVIRVRTVVRRPFAERWSAQAIQDVRARPRFPNPQDEAQHSVEPESSTSGINLGTDTGVGLEEARAHDDDVKVRDFRVTKNFRRVRLH